MANRYWVGGSGTWNSSDTTHWSATSGGAGGASVPTVVDAVVFNSSSGGGVVTMPSGTDVSCASIATSGFGGTFSASGASLRVYGSVSLINGLLTSKLSLYLYATGSASLRVEGNDFSVIEVNSSSAVYTLTYRLRTVDYLVVRSGTLKFGSYSVDVRNIRVTGSTSKLYLGSNTTTVSSSSSIGFIVESGGQVFAETSTVYMRSVYVSPFTSSVTFSGGGQSYYNVVLESDEDGPTTTNISGNNTIQNLSIISNGPHTIKFADGSTTNINTASLSHGTGIYTTLQPTTPATSTFTLNCTSANQVDLDFVKVQSSTATPANIWYAGNNSTDLGGNTGWVFGASTQAKFNPYFRGCF